MRTCIRLTSWLWILAVLLNCTPSPAETPAAPPTHAPETAPHPEPVDAAGACPRVTATHVAFRNRAKLLPEVSGLVPSALSSDLWWVHNDSGDKARVYAMDASGVRARVRMRKTSVKDAEDIAMWARLNRPPLLYLADTGDNFRRRQHVTIHRFPEPSVPTGRGPQGKQDRKVAKLKIGKPLLGHIRVRYKHGPQDVEAMFVDPNNGDIYLISKGRSGTNHVYRVSSPQFVGELHTALEVANFRLGLVTGADIARDGLGILVRTYLSTWLFTRTKEQSIVEALNGYACMLESAEEPQGESVAWSPDGRSFYTLSEGRDEPLNWHTLQPSPTLR